MDGKQENNRAAEQIPPKPPLWARAVYWPGLTLFALIFLSGADVWSDKLYEVLAGWGVAGGSGSLGGLILMPILIGVFMNAHVGAYRATARPVAEGMLWGAALFLIVPAMLVILHFAAPGFAASDNAEWVQLTPLPLLAIWVYVGYRRGEREVERLKSDMEREARNGNARDPAPGPGDGTGAVP